MKDPLESSLLIKVDTATQFVNSSDIIVPL
jgi:hypothetical protein